jgi:hypothetical protein
VALKDGKTLFAEFSVPCLWTKCGVQCPFLLDCAIFFAWTPRSLLLNVAFFPSSLSRGPTLTDRPGVPNERGQQQSSAGNKEVTGAIGLNLRKRREASAECVGMDVALVERQ